MQRWQIPHSAQTIIYKHGADFASSTEVTVRGDAAEAVAKLLEQQGKSSTDAAKVGRLFGDNVLDELQFREWNGVWRRFFFLFLSLSLSLFFKCHFLKNTYLVYTCIYVMACFYSLFSCACHNRWIFPVFSIGQCENPHPRGGQSLSCCRRGGLGAPRYEHWKNLVV